ncbi:MAG: hypothetical protein LQ347_006504 [Umbilicaria vellea]|nr:MAG: hypothetical protein LQ347_006504 [Umbilicaria vellea]
MRPSPTLLQHTARITLFTRANCSLCETAKTVLSNVKKGREFEYNEINVMEPGQRQWKDLYEFDTPVSLVEVHVQRIFHTYSKPDIATEARKLMHRFTEGEVEALIEEAEGHS